MTTLSVKAINEQPTSTIGQQNLDVLFAYMPYHKLSHPALGASILKSCLQQKNITTKIKYFGLSFAERIGYKAYQKFLWSNPVLLQGEWTFTDAAFGKGFRKKQEEKLGKSFSGLEKYHEDVAEVAELWIQEQASHIIADPPKIIICSSMFQQNMASLAMLRHIKELCPNTITIMGGPNTEAELGVALLRRAPWLDYISSGEGEETLPLLCTKLISYQSNFESPMGVISQDDVKAGDRTYTTINKRPSLASMDESPAPDFDDFFSDLKRSSLNIKPGLLLESSRGCWWGQRSHCTFCGLNGDGMSYRARTPEKMADIVHGISKKYNLKKIEFVDNIIAKDYFDSFLPLIEDEDLTMFYETKADFSESNAEQFYKSGVRFIQPGIESLNDEVLKLMRKGTSTAVNIECLRLCREYGLWPAWTIISDFPGENEKSYRETTAIIPKIVHLQPPNGMVTVRFDRFSPYHDNPDQWGLNLVPIDSYQFIYPPIDGGHSDIAYFFKRKGEYDKREHRYQNQNEAYKTCRLATHQWIAYWKLCKKENRELPKLLLKNQDDKWFVVDTRGGEEVKTEVSTEMAVLVTNLRSKKSHISINKRHNEILAIDLSSFKALLKKALEMDWIIDISRHYVSVVQTKMHDQPNIINWPGGVVIDQ